MSGAVCGWSSWVSLNSGMRGVLSCMPVSTGRNPAEILMLRRISRLLVQDAWKLLLDLNRHERNGVAVGGTGLRVAVGC
jgi:hypothetical protein